MSDPGGPPDGGGPRYTVRAHKAILFALGEARKRGAAEAGWEDLLRGLSRIRGCAADLVLAQLGLELVRWETESPAPPEASRAAHTACGDTLRTVLLHAHLEALKEEAAAVGTLHLLLGLLADLGAAAAGVLRASGLDPERIRSAAAELGAAALEAADHGVVEDASVADEEVERPEGAGVWRHFTEASLGAIRRAQVEAAARGCGWTMTEHLLLGILLTPGASASIVLAVMDVPFAGLLEKLTQGLEQEAKPLKGLPPLSPLAVRAIRCGIAEAREFGTGHVGTGHLLLGLMRAGENGAERHLRSCGVTPLEVRRHNMSGADLVEAPAVMAPGEEPQAERRWHLPSSGDVRYTNRARLALLRARTEAQTRGNAEAGWKHLLLALVNLPDTAASRLLEWSGSDLGGWAAANAAEAAGGVAPEPAQGLRIRYGASVWRVLESADREVRRAGQALVTTADLLLALGGEGGSPAAAVLRELGVDPERLRRGMEELGREALEAADLSTERPSVRAGSVGGDPPRAATSKGGARMWQRFTERARRVVFFAQEEAARLGENYVGTEHLLLGLLRESDSVGSHILDRIGVPLGRIRDEIERQVTRGHGNLGQDMQITPRAKRVIDLAYEEARGLNNNYIGTEHLLLGLVREGNGLAGRVLVKLGATVERVRKEVQSMQEEGEQQGAGAAARPADAMQKLWDLPYAELRKLSQYAQEGRNPLGAASAAMVAVDLARTRCGELRDLLGIGDLSADQAWALLSLARVLKDTLGISKVAHREILAGKTLAMIFEKPSLRTRTTFEVGMFQLGGHALYLSPTDIQMGKRESVSDVARNLERWVDGIVARVFAHATVQELAGSSIVPVVNGLCDREHPCQALADLMTVWERRGSLEGQRIVYVGDGNNVANSLMLLGAKLGAHMVVASPAEYAPPASILETAQRSAEGSGGSATVTTDPVEACTNADVIYTDVWTSMGQESEAEERRKVLAPYQVGRSLAAAAKPDFIFMHCLPAHREEEVTSEVIDGPNSVVLQQAENRLHAQKAVLAVLLG